MQNTEDLTIVCLSDTHTQKVDIPQGDILIHCGDFTNWGFEYEVRDFIQWIKSLPHKHKIVTPGNHDVSLDLQRYPYFKQKLHRYQNEFDEKKLFQDLKDCCHLLINESITVEGYKFWGSPYTQEYGDWAFAIQGNSQDFWKQIEEQTDIVITHGPPFHYGDKISANYSRVGDRYLIERLKEIKPKYHVYGGVHEGYGITEEDGGYNEDAIKFVNCSILDQWFKVQNKPIVLNLPRR